MRLGPYKGYYGRAFWCDVDNKFKGWIICKERFQFVSNKEEMLNYNFKKAVSTYMRGIKMATSNITLGVNMDPELKQMFADLSAKIDKLNENIEKFNAHQISIDQSVGASFIEVTTFQTVLSKAIDKACEAFKSNK